jgi:hypothetical protein
MADHRRTLKARLGYGVLKDPQWIGTRLFG